MCAICHGNIAPNEVALVRDCDHPFCSLCILNWAKQRPKCPLCLTGFTHLWLYRRLDGTYNDYLVEESVDLLHCAVWFRKAVTSEFVQRHEDDDEQPDDYHEMLQWMYGGGRERDDDDDAYDDLQEDLERGVGPRRGKAFGQRRYGSGGFIASGGSRLAARVPQAPPAQGGGKATFSKKKGFESKHGFDAAGSSSEVGGEGDEGASPRGGGGKKPAAGRKAEKQALKDAQKEKRRSWAKSVEG